MKLRTVLLLLSLCAIAYSATPLITVAEASGLCCLSNADCPVEFACHVLPGDDCDFTAPGYCLPVSTQ